MTPITTTMMILHRTTIPATITLWRLAVQNRPILPKTRPYRRRLPGPRRSPMCREASSERKRDAKRTWRSMFETSRDASDVFCNERDWSEAGICRFIRCNQIRGRLKNKYHRLDNRNLKAPMLHDLETISGSRYIRPQECQSRQGGAQGALRSENRQHEQHETQTRHNRGGHAEHGVRRGF